ncbi:Clavaminate synthase-like protein [Mycena venus]|uniref:Clavaminate synthase-like protein n=1 Tax=Mycena venus TaxID=2733690 RepID=A0A8H6WY51_9AGAR|nr:Clavaminate synthase-like protein [Mycena venus]
MSSPAVHRAMSIDRLLNSPVPSPTFMPPRAHTVQPQNTRRVPPTPQMNQAYVDPRAAETDYSLGAVDSWGEDMSNSSRPPPAPVRANSLNSYPSNRLIAQSTQLIQFPDAYEPTAAPPHPAQLMGVAPNWSNANAYELPSTRSIYSDKQRGKRTTLDRPNASRSYGSPSISSMDSEDYSDDTERTGLSSHYASHETPYPRSSYSQRESPEIDASQYQRVERASLRLVAQNSPGTYEHFHEQFSEMKKRGLLHVEDAEEPPKKRKHSAKPAFNTNKRSGYAAKKRSDLIPAQSDQSPDIMYTMEKPAKGKDRDGAPYRVIPVKFPGNTSLQREDQTSRCMSSRYKSDEYPKCVACTRRWAGDTCRFQNLRSFYRDKNGSLVGVSFTESQEIKAPQLDYPDKWNIPLDKTHLQQTKKIIAAALLPTLRAEVEHINFDLVIYRPRECEVRATCDTCLTSIFCCSWMCRTCGREACPECYQQIKNITTAPGNASQDQLDELQARKDRILHGNPSFLNCLKRNEHGARDFAPMTRFTKSELAEAIRNMEQLLQDEGIPVPGPAPTGSVHASTKNGPHTLAQNIAPSPSNDSESTLVPSGDATLPDAEPSSPIARLIPEDIPSHDILRFSDSELTDDIFRPLWAQGDPLLVKDVGKKLKINWSPEYFITKYGNESCVIIECQTEENRRTTVGDFFKDFGKYEGRDKCWKLKDWPPEKDFKTDFPELYDDFNQAVPIPHYVRRDGALNIGSHFPTNTIGPDLGPKMYNANANREIFGSKGSTRLHMDMADALNLMTYAAPDADGKEGCAAWDLFRAQDSEKIRQFMRAKYTALIHGLDPIHVQQVYLDDEARRQLWEEYGVKSYRVYQKAGEAVFIPAGCAHQVRNLSDCIKVAIDFVSPENIERCEKLTKEFREVNQTKAWKEDVLQLRTMMWFAWLSCCRQESLGRAL